MLQGHSDIDVYIKKQKQTKKITNKLFFYPFSQKNKQIFENPQYAILTLSLTCDSCGQHDYPQLSLMLRYKMEKKTECCKQQAKKSLDREVAECGQTMQHLHLVKGSFSYLVFTFYIFI